MTQIGGGAGHAKRRAKRRHDLTGGETVRNPFRQDRDRILYSAGFRRLGGITQISAASEIMLLHNRLTHSLKVGQVGRTLAEGLLLRYSDVLDETRDLDADVVEAAGLAHDIGHPPFGHAGEKVLARIMEDLSAGGFEGNAQTVRYVAKIALRKRETDPGSGALDLTRATLNAIMKYPWSHSQVASGAGSAATTPSWDDRNIVPAIKYNAYSVDSAVYDWVRRDYRDGHRTLEAAIMDWADDISYAVHDFEDYVRAGLIPIHALELSLAPFSEFAWSILSKRYEGRGFRRTAFDQAVAELAYVGWKTPFDGSREAENRLRAWVSGQITRAQNSTRLSDPSLFGFEDDARLEIDDTTSYRIEVLKLVPFYFVISTPGFDLAQRGQQRLLERVFESLFEIAKKRPVSMPPGLVAILNSLDREPLAQSQEEANRDALPARAVCDYLCTLTENQVVELDRRLSGSSDSMLYGAWLP